MEKENGKRRKSLIKKNLLMAFMIIVVLILCSVIGLNVTKAFVIVFGGYLIYITLYVFNKWKNNQEKR